MIYLGLIENSDKIGCEYARRLGEAVGERIGSAKNAASRTSRLSAYSLIARMYEDLRAEGVLSAEMPEICYTDGGKPEFCENNSLQNGIKFNISHDEIFSVCAFSDAGDVGVDIQAMPKRRINLSRIADRFFAPMRNVDSALSREDADCDVKIFFYKEASGEIVPCEPKKIKRIKDASLGSDFLSKWTLLEAVLKKSGGGFGDTERAESLIKDSETATFSFLHNGDEFFVSVAIDKRKS